MSGATITKAPASVTYTNRLDNKVPPLCGTQPCGAGLLVAMEPTSPAMKADWLGSRNATRARGFERRALEENALEEATAEARVRMQDKAVVGGAREGSEGQKKRPGEEHY